MEKLIDCWSYLIILLTASDIKKLRKEIEELGTYDLHDILRRQKKVEWCEWHLNINQNDKAIEIAGEFHRNSRRLKLSSSIADQVHTIEKTFLEFMPKTNHWDEIRDFFKQGREQNEPSMIIKAYTFSKEFSTRLNKHLAVNTYHALKLYCTSLNCPILAQTEEYTEAFARILFHPKLEGYSVRSGTYYRGIFLEDKKLVDNYNEQATILTTTFLSTSMNPEVANHFGSANSENGISVSCVYNIKNIRRRTALDLRDISFFEQEAEILILPYIPFRIKSIQRTDDGRHMTICFDECDEECVNLDECIPLSTVFSSSEAFRIDQNCRRIAEEVVDLDRSRSRIRCLPKETRISLSSIRASTE